MSQIILKDLEFYVPVKDGALFIEDCLKAIFDQSYLPSRVIVYYNINTKDNTREICKKFPVQIIDVPFPLSDARNHALKEIKTPWLGCCDADVILDKNWIKNLWEKIDTGATILSGNTCERILDPGDKLRSIISPHNWGDFDIYNPYMFVPDMIARRERLLEIGGYKTGWVNYEDSDISQRLKEAGDFFYYVSSAKATHHRSDHILSCLDLRWRYSLQRQKDLFSSKSGILKKMRNNFSLATLTLSQIRQHKENQLIKAALFLPLHHFYCDLDYLAQEKITEPEKIRTIFNKFYQTYTSRASEPSNNNDPNEYSVSEDEWQNLMHRTKQMVYKIHKIESMPLYDSQQHTKIDALKQLSHGFYFFRQKLWPDQTEILSCRDLSIKMAEARKKILWTETFQGSTIIAFESEGKHV